MDSQGTVFSPLGYGTTVAQVSGVVLPANPTRKGLTIHNPSAGVSIAICPAQVNQGQNGVYTGLATGTAVINGAGSITLAPGDKFIIDNLSCTSAFNGIASGPGGLASFWEHI